jgi:hypothetical protein
MQEICLAPRQVRKEGALLKRGSQNDFLEEFFWRIRLRASQIHLLPTGGEGHKGIADAWPIDGQGRYFWQDTGEGSQYKGNATTGIQSRLKIRYK